MTNVTYRFYGNRGYGELHNGVVFIFDRKDYAKISNVKWYTSWEGGRPYLINSRGKKLHNYLMECPYGYEIDHVNHDTLDNRTCNLRICTHQQNQCNQPLQKNNTSGVTGVSYYSPRRKFRARIKACQHDIHLGYYKSFKEAVQARNVAMQCMFGEYGVYNKVEEAPEKIKEQVINICKRFVDYSICEAFLLFVHKYSEVEIKDGE